MTCSSYDVFFLVVGPESAATARVKTSSRVGQLARQAPFREQLLRARDAKEFYPYLCYAERQ